MGQRDRDGVGGRITGYASEPAFGFVSLDATRAYPGKELRGWQRSLVLDKEHNFAVVLDRVRCAVGAEIEVRRNHHFGHSRAYFERAAAAAGLEPERIAEVVHETAEGEAQPGFAALLRRPA